LSRLDKGSIILTHEGGILRVPLAEASPELIHAIQAKTGLFQSMKALPTFTLGSQKLTSVIALDLQSDPIVLWHQNGVLTVPASQLNKAQLQVLAATNPNLHPSEPSVVTTSAPGIPPANLSVSKSDGLRFGTGAGEREPQGWGWECAADETKQWQTASQEVPDEAPPELSGHAGESPLREDPQFYKKSLAFINSRIAPLELGYNRSNQCLVFRHQFNGGSAEIDLALDPHRTDARVTFGDSKVVIEGRDGAESIILYHPEQTRKGDYHLRRDLASRITLPVHDAERVAKALSAVLQLLGASAGTF
jgi:hypothetical protein